MSSRRRETLDRMSISKESLTSREKKKKTSKKKKLPQTKTHHPDHRQEHRLPERPDVVARGARAAGAHREERDEEDDLLFFWIFLRFF